jgi:hypothetical protein
MLLYVLSSAVLSPQRICQLYAAPGQLSGLVQFFILFFWVSQLFVKHLVYYLDFTKLDSAVTHYVVFKLHFMRLSTMPVIFFIFSEFHSTVITTADNQFKKHTVESTSCS